METWLFCFVTEMLQLYEILHTKRRNSFFNGILKLRGKEDEKIQKE